VIDLHSHVLPGLDDGASDLEEAVAICRAAAADGIQVLAGTPHVSFHYRTTPEAMEAALLRVRDAVGDLVEVVGGGEVTLEELTRPVEELRRFALGGSDHVLVETPYSGWPLDIAQRLFVLRSQRLRPVLAHPERNADVQSRPELLQPLVDAGALVQLTAASLDGRIGGRAERCARTLLDRRLAHLIASDAHAPAVRAVGMSTAARAVGDDALARWLTVGVPAAILAGERIPERPAVTRRRGLFRR
jgi:protein-tyrosine phosphatase